ncbi:MAG: co-chaperone GroES [bacterium]
MMLKPLGDRIIVSIKTADEMSRGGIFLPETAKEKPHEGEIIAVGPGRMMEDGKLSQMEVNVGDRVLLNKYGGTEVTVGGKDFTIVRQDDILAVLDK